MSRLKVEIDYVEAQNVINSLRQSLYLLDVSISGAHRDLEKLDVFLKDLKGLLDRAVFKDPHKSDQGAWP